MPRYIDADKLTEEYIKLQYSDQSMGIVCNRYMSEIARVSRQPTVDVAPKSEVAREIFGEIESMLIRYTFEDGYGEYISTGLVDEFAELKKKYTEEKT
jgi:hypothetical protein